MVDSRNQFRDRRSHQQRPSAPRKTLGPEHRPRRLVKTNLLLPVRRHAPSILQRSPPDRSALLPFYARKSLALGAAESRVACQPDQRHVRGVQRVAVAE